MTIDELVETISEYGNLKDLWSMDVNVVLATGAVITGMHYDGTNLVLEQGSREHD